MDRPRSWRVQGIDLPSEPPLRVGGAAIDPVSREATFAAGTERLQPQILKVLIALVRQKGEVVTRDKLIDLCWDGRIVGEDVINHSISVLRTLAARVGGFEIETVPKAGYRLIETQAQPAESKDRQAAFAIGILLACVAGGGAWYWASRGSGAAGREMEVRLAGFTSLSPAVPPTMLQSLGDETVAAFAGDGAIGVTTAPGGENPYQLSGAVDRRGSSYSVIVRIDNARSGASLWSRRFDYSAADSGQLARDVALNLANITRCGFGRSYTYPKALPDSTLRLVFAGCENDGTIDSNLDRALDYQRRVTQATPDYSAGWTALAGTAAVLGPQKPPAAARALALEANRALSTALRLDPRNSEAWALKAYTLPVTRFAQREALFKRAIASRPLDCGCEHHAYGQFLNEVGRLKEASREYQRGIDFMPLNEWHYQDLALAQFAAGDRANALETLEAGKKVSRRPARFEVLKACFAVWAGDYAKARQILSAKDVRGNGSAQMMGPAVEALATRDSAAVARARATLLALAEDPQANQTLAISMLAMLGDTDNALAAIRRLAPSDPISAYGTLFDPALWRARGDASYWNTARELGLVDYWTRSRQLPDFCLARNAPAACRSLG
jgi:DNA-binding winged helix-turn-helix (wHTH) protein/tetratricopeptide (TPR) repeat protein